MRFCVKCNLLTDDTGKAVHTSHPERVRHLFVEATDAAEAITSVARTEQSDVPTRIHHLDEMQAVATVRRGRSAMMLHAFPEEEATWRRQE